MCFNETHLNKNDASNFLVRYRKGCIWEILMWQQGQEKKDVQNPVLFWVTAMLPKIQIGATKKAIKEGPRRCNNIESIHTWEHGLKTDKIKVDKISHRPS